MTLSIAWVFRQVEKFQGQVNAMEHAIEYGRAQAKPHREDLPRFELKDLHL
jgi:hypothetical protein